MEEGVLGPAGKILGRRGKGRTGGREGRHAARSAAGVPGNMLRVFSSLQASADLAAPWRRLSRAPQRSAHGLGMGSLISALIVTEFGAYTDRIPYQSLAAFEPEPAMDSCASCARRVARRCT
jgi:hypothetical protein